MTSRSQRTSSTPSPGPQIAEHDSGLAATLAEFVLAAPAVRRPPKLSQKASGKHHERWQRMQQLGSMLWLDAADLDSSARAWTPDFSGFTTNNSLLAAEVDKGLYDDLIADAAALLRDQLGELEGERRDRAVVEVGFVLNAVHGLVLTGGFGADVCVELHTDCAHDAEASYQQGRRLHALCPDRFVVKVPLTPAGLIAAARLEHDGVRVNVTLGFSPRQNRLIAGLARPHFVNVFLGRVEGLVDAVDLDGITPADTAIAAVLHSQRMLREVIGEGDDANHAVRQIAASLRRPDQLPRLCGVDVLTMPVEVASDFAAGAADQELQDRTAAAPPALDDELMERARAAGLDVFWNLDKPADVAARQLALREPQTLDAGRVQAVLADNSLGDLFGELSAADRQRIRDDGKIPDVAFWRDRVQAGAASWDGLLGEAGLGAFAADQARIDERIRERL